MAAVDGDHRAVDEADPVRGHQDGHVANTYANRPVNTFADGDLVIVECRRKVATKLGQPYNNTYWYVFRMADGKMTVPREYMDTALADAVPVAVRRNSRPPCRQRARETVGGAGQPYCNLRERQYLVGSAAGVCVI